MKLYGLVGKNIEYSFSRAYFNNKFKTLNIEAEYKNFDIKTIDDFMHVLNDNPRLDGLNVTIPYKEEIIPFLHDIDPLAKNIGAVNTIKIVDNKLIGYNTDVYGFTKSIFLMIEPHHENALVLGTGGASKAIKYALKSVGYEVSTVSRDEDKADFTYKDLDEAVLENHQLIVNCTPLGTHPNTSDCPPIPFEFVTEHHLLYDLIYNPTITTFLAQGKQHGANIMNGEQMLNFQAEQAWEIWNGED